MTEDIEHPTAEPVTEVFADRAELTDAVAQKLLKVLTETVAAESQAHISLTGGSAGIATLAATAQLVRDGQVATPDWAAVHFWWGDERLLPAGDSERNEVQAHAALLDELVANHGLPHQNIHPMPTSEEAADPAAGAEMYAQALQAHSAAGGINGLLLPQITISLLGVGPDGHINSLFPGKESLKVSGVATGGEDSAPAALGPPMRVTLTFAALHSATRVWTVVSGPDKADAVARAFTEGVSVDEIPARGARGRTETVWHLDQAAAAQLP